MLKATIEDGQVVFRVPLCCVVELQQNRPTAHGLVESLAIIDDDGDRVTVRVDDETMKTLWDAKRASR